MSKWVERDGVVGNTRRDARAFLGNPIADLRDWPSGNPIAILPAHGKAGSWTVVESPLRLHLANPHALIPARARGRSLYQFCRRPGCCTVPVA